MAFVVALDERLDDADLEVRRCGGQRALHAIERQHDPEVMLELGLRYLRVALELSAHAAIEPTRIARGEIGRNLCLSFIPGLDYVRQALQPIGEACQPVGRSPGPFGPGHTGSRRGQLS